jgi:type IV secretion system protein TrbL
MLLLGIENTSPPTATPPDGNGCAWWDLLCQGGHQVADSGLSAITQSMVQGLIALFGQITKIVDESTRIPLGDPTYRHTYFGFAGLAVPIIAVVFFIALISSAIRRDPRTLGRATVGIGVAGIGGMVYILFAQLLVALDDWLAHGVVAVTGADFGKQMAGITDKFELMGNNGAFAADALMLILMSFALVAGVSLWVVLLLRKMAILVVVAFAPILIAGWLWGPTRGWSRKATEVLVALVFSKSVIYMIFGVGMSLLLRGNGQTLSDFVGVVVLLCGACFAPLVMLRLVHFAADSHLASDMVGTLRAGAQPTITRVTGPARGLQRRHMANDYASGHHGSPARGGEATVSPGGPRPGAAASAPSAPAMAGTAGGTGSAAVAGPVAVAAAVGVGAAKKVSGSARTKVASGGEAMSGLSGPAGSAGPTAAGPSDNDREG